MNLRPTSRRGMLLAACLLAGPAAGQAAPVSRDTLVKAAFLHKFASFVEWPAGTFPRPDTPLHIGILGDDQLWRDLSELARDRQRDGRPVQVTRLTSTEGLAGFHIVYLKSGSPGRITDLLAAVPEGILTVADSDGAHPRGSVLSFFLEQGRVRFGASPEAAARQKLRLSSRLLTVARVVRARQPGSLTALA